MLLKCYTTTQTQTELEMLPKCVWAIAVCSLVYLTSTAWKWQSESIEKQTSIPLIEAADVVELHK